MAARMDFPFLIDQKSGGNAGHSVNARTFGNETALARPGVVGFIPAVFREMIDCRFFLLIDADCQKLDIGSPVRIFGAVGLHLVHRRLAGAAPEGPEFENYDFSLEMRKFPLAA